MQPSQFFKCLSDDTRLLSVLMIHREGELCVCELMAALDDSQPKISRHLAQLRACGVLSDRRDRQWVYYAMHPGLPDWALGILDTTSRAQDAELTARQQRLDAMQCRPTRCA